MKEVLFDGLVKRPVVVLTGAGSTCCLGLRLMDSFLDLLATDLKSYPDAQSALTTIIREVGRKDLELLLGRLEDYRKVTQLAAKDHYLRHAVGGQNYGAFQAATGRLETQLKDLLFKHYGDVDGDRAREVFEPLLDMVAEWNEGLVPFFTTNYDPTIETIVELAQDKCRLIDGFRERGRRQVWDDHIFCEQLDLKQRSHNVLLCKLHGSIFWKEEVDGTIKNMPHPVRTIEGLSPVLLYPMETKQPDREPFATLYHLLAACLRNARVCLVIGYSFRDPKLTQTFEEALASNKHLQLIVVDPNVEAGLGAKLGAVGSQGIAMPWGQSDTHAKVLSLVKASVESALQ